MAISPNGQAGLAPKEYTSFRRLYPGLERPGLSPTFSRYQIAANSFQPRHPRRTVRRLRHVARLEERREATHGIDLRLVADVSQQEDAVSKVYELLHAPLEAVVSQRQRVNVGRAITREEERFVSGWRHIAADDKHQVALAGSQYRLIPVHD